jgi:hypothetical protein
MKTGDIAKQPAYIANPSNILEHTSKVSVTIGGQHLKHTIVNGQDADIKSTTSKVKHKDILFSSLLV